MSTQANISTRRLDRSRFYDDLPLTTFDGLATNTEVNGLTVDGILFNYMVEGIPTNGQLNIDGGPGVTNHVSAPLIVSPRFLGGVQPGTLLLTLPSFADALGYGFAELTSLPLSDATTITVFSGNTAVGSLVYSGSPDPSLTGGFAAICEHCPFQPCRAQLPDRGRLVCGRPYRLQDPQESFPNRVRFFW
ncbi:hypothetical protein [Edaphobacter aggregans]|uniref:hypothetical protein n=1 Tax=Edaphobacter aggregans TaxID=570835 RepID=UPI0005530BAF|nr:hypothetical protein [Edaphobacter aggregans]